MKILVIFAVFLAACTPSRDHGHAHGSSEAHSHGETDRPIEDITLRLDSVELFVKYAALILDELSTFETYVTRLDSYRPIDSLKVTVSLIQEGKGIRHSVEAPNKNGVYLPALQPTNSGLHRLVVDLASSEIDQRIELGEVQVYKNQTEMEDLLAHSHGDDSGIDFSKIQSWEIDFQTEVVNEDVIFEVVKTSGVWKAAPGDSKTLVAYANGVVNFNQNLLTEGAMVSQGQTLMTITSKGLHADNLEVEIEKAKADHNQITAEYERQQLLYEEDLIAKAEWERSESKYLVSKATIESLQQGYVEGGKQIQVPFNGYVQSIDVENGEYVTQGMELFTVRSLNYQILQTHVSTSYSVVPSQIHDIWFKLPDSKWSSMKQSGGSILSVGREVSEQEPLLPIYAKVNTPQRLAQGSYTEVQIGLGGGKSNLVIPESALIENYGNYSVMVQLNGESYQKRPVQLGKRNGQYAEVIAGLKKDEIVVTKGAYQVKMASVSASVPGHGHEH
jgi:RND family efflux transporter MFP subunit